MFESAELENFQKYTHQRIEFDPLVTSLLGRTEAGKSTILRFLRWVATNRPTGDGGIRKHGEDSVGGVLRVDGHVIERSRKGKENTYTLDGRVFHAFGTAVPEEIEKLLNLCDATFQGQLDPPWWFMLSPGEVSRELNAVVSLDLIDSMLAGIAKEQRRSKVATDLSETRLLSAEGRVKSLSWVPKADTELKEIEALAQQIEEEQELLKSTSAILADIDRDRATLRGGRERLQALEEVISLGEVVQRVTEELNAVEAILDDLKGCREKAAISQGALDSVNRQIEEGLLGQCPLCGGEWDGC